MFSGRLQTRIGISLLLFIISTKGLCQVANYMPNIIPPSPNAASLMKFADVPVNTYTGTANINIPIYNIQARGINVPISLDYGTGGIRVKEEAGWVGLGWTLNAGGMISRTIMGLDDFGGEYFGTIMPDITGNLLSQPAVFDLHHVNISNMYGPYVYDFFCDDSVYTDQGTKNFANALATSASSSDFEPDIFHYNFLGRSGKFIINRSGKVILQKQENLIVKYASDGSSFTIIDDQGNKFYFLDREYTESSSGGVQTTSSWMLSKVITQQNDTVKFNYYTDNTWTTTAGDPYEIIRASCPPNNQSFTGTTLPNMYLNLTLSTIDFNNGQLQFNFDNARTDLSGGFKLKGIKVYSKNAAGALNYVKEHQLFYSYFSSTASLELQRLRLDSVKEVSGNAATAPYSFIYNIPGFYPAKHSYNVDHWGYFNGSNNTASQFTPEFYGTFSTDEYGAFPIFQYLPGANRDPDSSSMRAFSLQQVSYPTGGQTVFQYESNTYDDLASRFGPLDFPQMHVIDTTVAFSITAKGASSGSIDLSNVNTTEKTPYIYYSVAFKASGKADTTIYRNNTNINFTFNSTFIPMSSLSLSCGGPVCSTGLTYFNPTNGVMSWTANIDPTIPGFDGIYVNVSWQEDATVHNKNSTYIAGGLRIKSITDYSAPGVVAKQRRYDYSYQASKYGWPTTSYSYGKLMSYPNYARYEVAWVSAGQDELLCHGLTRTSGSNTSLNSEIQGNIVGYDQVAEYTIDPQTGIDIGKTVYNYFNSPDTAIYYYNMRYPGMINYGNNLNGLLTSKVVYKNSSNSYFKLSETDNTYHTTNRIVYLNMKPIYIPNTGGVSLSCTTEVNQFLACLYPSIKSEKILQDQTQDIIYDQTDTNKFVSTIKSFYYDNPLHYQVTRTRSLDSRNNTNTAVLKYPQDYLKSGLNYTGNTIIDSLIGRNMVSEVIEKKDSFNYSGSSTAYTKGGQLNLYRSLSAGTMGLAKQYQLSLQMPVTDFQPFSFTNNTTSIDTRYRQMVSFDSYDNLNNIQQFTGVDLNSVSVVWDYKHVYPIAQVKNAVLADIAYSSFEADGTGGWTFTGTNTPETVAITGSNSYNLSQTSGTITKTGLTSSSTYIVSYWTKNASALSITGTVAGYPVKGKTIGAWTYYEHKITGQSTITVGGSGYIDELRLYPATAQMTSYVYTPLVGISASCDVDNRVSYYFYDGLGRLIYLKDQDGNIIKTIQYYFTPQLVMP